MSLFLATLLFGLFLVLLGAVLLWNNSVVASTARTLPRSRRGAWLFFGAGAGWFVWRVSRLTESDLIFFQTPPPVMAGFGVLAVLAFLYAPDFLAVRGLCVLVLLAAEPLLYAAYMEYQYPQRLLMVTGVYLASSPEVAGVTGKYFYKCKEKRTKKFKDEDAAAVRLWDESEKLVAACTRAGVAQGQAPASALDSATIKS